jgi:hypothetical protein
VAFGPCGFESHPGYSARPLRSGHVRTLTHCAKAFLRGGVWDPQTWSPPYELPSAAEIHRDHRDTPGLTVAQTQAELDESIRERMW